MDDQNLELQDSEPASESAALESAETAEQALLELEKVRQEKADIEQKNRELFERAKKAEERYYALKKQERPVQENTVTVDDVDMAILVAKGLSDDEIESLRPLAKGAGKRLRDVLLIPEAKVILDWKRSQTKSEQATPASSGRPIPVAGGSKPWAAMTEDERRANFDKVRSGFARRGQPSNE